MPSKDAQLSLKKTVFIVLMLLCLFPMVTGAAALILGVLFALVFKNPFLNVTQKHTTTLLQFSVVGLGFGMNLAVVAEVGLGGIAYTAIGIIGAMSLGLLLGRLLKTDDSTSLLICVGTAICGGSAIAAVSPVIRAKPNEISVALATVFFLNCSALLVFPFIGHALGLSEQAFGIWSALAIHDTSSVVGAALEYGDEAVQIATTMKLARALWIIPLAIVIGLFWNRSDTNAQSKAKKPWFILGFLIAAALVTWVPALKEPGEMLNWGAKRTLVMTLFLIGANLSASSLQKASMRPFIQGFVLWFFVALGTIVAIQSGWISNS